MNVTSLYTNSPKRRESKQYAEHTKQSTLTNLSIPTPLLEQSLRLIVPGDLSKKLPVQIYSSAVPVGTKKPVVFGRNRNPIIQSGFQPLVWKQCADDIFLLWTINRKEIYSGVH